MKNRHFRWLLVLALTGVLKIMQVHAATSPAANERLWYRQPATNWNTQALHLGNGYFGASFFGVPTQEVFTLGEKTFWLGGPGDGTNNFGIRPGGKDHIAEIRKLIVDGNIPEADALYCRTMSGDRSQFGALSTIGNLYLNFDQHPGAVSNYVRDLDLRQALASVSYEIDGRRYRREYFCSYPARALVMRVTCDKPGSVSFNMGIDPAHRRQHKPAVALTPARGLWEMSGNIDGNNRPYHIKMQVLNEGGAVSDDGWRLLVKNADAATIFYTVATDYLPTPPLYRGADPEAITAGVLRKLQGRSYASIRDEHVADYQRLYARTSFHLDGGRPEREALPTDERWKFYSQHDCADLGVREMAFNMGKYLLISASRPGALPAGLQGPFSCHYSAPWSGNYQININIPLIYMPGNVLGLSDCNEPFLEWIEALVVPGREVAKAYYGTRGWVDHATGNIWGFAAPGSSLEWGPFPSGAAWDCRHIWEQYEFTQDKHALRDRWYPVMKEAAQFWLENLTEYQGSLIAIPAVSAEQRSPKGFLLPPMQDIVFVRDLFANTVRAAETLDVDAEFRAQVAQAQARLMPFKIGRLGQLQEWIEDVDDPNCHHRHFMHIAAVHPCQQIDAHTDKVLAEAARVTMNLRGDSNNAQRLDPSYPKTKCACTHCGMPHDPHIGGNWSRSWKCWIWARLLDGDRVDKIWCEMLGEASSENMTSYQQKPPSGKPLQLDGSVTTPGFVAEMLMQSQNGEIDLLPALPKSWKSGSIKGLRARGGFVVDLEWQDGKVASYRIAAAEPHEVKVRINDEIREITSERL